MDRWGLVKGVFWAQVCPAEVQQPRCDPGVNQSFAERAAGTSALLGSWEGHV